MASETCALGTLGATFLRYTWMREEKERETETERETENGDSE